MSVLNIKYTNVKGRTVWPVAINYSLTYLLGGESAWKGAEPHKGCGYKELRFHVDVGTLREMLMLFVLIQNQNYDFSLHVK